MIIEEIVLGGDIKDKQKAIRDNIGKEVILNDFHNNWCHGILLKEDEDDREVVYQINILNAKGARQLHYHDLKQLLILKPYKLE